MDGRPVSEGNVAVQKARQDKTRHDMTGHGKTRQDKIRQNEAETKPNKNKNKKQIKTTTQQQFLDKRQLVE